MLLVYCLITLLFADLDLLEAKYVLEYSDTLGYSENLQIPNPLGTYQAPHSLTISRDGSTAVVSSYASKKENIKHYHRQDGSWDFLESLSLPGSADTDEVHHAREMALSANGKVLVVGMPFHDKQGSGADHGAVFVYRQNDEKLFKLSTTLELESSSSHDIFGYSVDISDSGNEIVVGAPFDEAGNSDVEDQGSVLVFEYKSGNWIRQVLPAVTHIGFGQAKLDLEGVYLGASVTISGDGKIITTSTDLILTYAGSNPNFLLVQWVKSGDQWLATSAVGTPVNGKAVSISNLAESHDGREIAFGIRNEGCSKLGDYIWLYKFVDESSYYSTKIYGSHPNERINPCDLFGFAVSLSGQGDKIAIGAPWANELEGKVHMYSQDSKELFGFYRDYTISSPSNSSVEFGSAVEMSENGRTVVIGSKDKVYFYETNETLAEFATWSPTASAREGITNSPTSEFNSAGVTTGRASPGLILLLGVPLLIVVVGGGFLTYRVLFTKKAVGRDVFEETQHDSFADVELANGRSNQLTFA